VSSSDLLLPESKLTDSMIKIEELPNDAPVQDPIQTLQRGKTSNAASQEQSKLVQPQPGYALPHGMQIPACTIFMAAD
jgi:hypothetical protein